MKKNNKYETTNQKIFRKSCQIILPRLANKIEEAIPAMFKAFMDKALKG